MKKISICLFEDKSTKWFGPLTFTRPVWELRIGAYTFLQKLRLQFPEQGFRFSCRTKITRSYAGSTDLGPLKDHLDTDVVLFVNGRMILDNDNVQQLLEGTEECLYLSGDEVAAFRVKTSNLARIRWNDENILDTDCLKPLPGKAIKARLFRYPWELIKNSGNEICSDLALAKRHYPGSPLSIPSYVTVRNPGNIEFIGEVNFYPGVIIDAENNIVRFGNNTKIGSGVILDSNDGPIWIDDDTEIQPGAIIQGPVHIGKNSIVRPGAKISNGVSLGPHCRVGGEVSATIMIGYSNKQHSGYLGSSYIGEWVNFGAATDNSDLKNNYRPVDVMIEGEKIDSGDLHVGSIIADHCKTAIHTRLNTGTVVGVCCNLFGSDFPVKYVPSFTWFGSDSYVEYKVEKALETIAVVMSRRGKTLTPAMSELLKDIFLSTAHERNALFT